jgi:hypothetical protein
MQLYKSQFHPLILRTPFWIYLNVLIPLPSWYPLHWFSKDISTIDHSKLLIYAFLLRSKSLCMKYAFILLSKMSHYHNLSWFTGYLMILNTEMQWLGNKQIAEYSELLSGYSSHKVREATNASSITDWIEHLASQKHITLLAILPNVTWGKPQYRISYAYE